MVFTPVEIIALIVIIGVAIKMLVLLVNPKKWIRIAKTFYKNAALAQIVGLILAGIILYYLVLEGISIVQILAVMALFASLLVVGLAPYLDDLIKKYEGMIKRGRLWKENWLYTLLWIVLLSWALKELFM